MDAGCIRGSLFRVEQEPHVLVAYNVLLARLFLLEPLRGGKTSKNQNRPRLGGSTEPSYISITPVKEARSLRLLEVLVYHTYPANTQGRQRVWHNIIERRTTSPIASCAREKLPS